MNAAYSPPGPDLPPQVTVVIPTRGRASLRRAVDSVIAQTEPNFEIVVVDDHAGPGDVQSILRNIVDPRLRCIALSGSTGAAAARNAAIQSTRATYVAFLDDDDEWLPEKLALQLAIFESSDETLGVVYTARLTIHQDTGEEIVSRFPDRFCPGVTDNVVTTSSVMLKRRCFDRAGLFDERLAIGSDYDMWIRIGQYFGFQYADRPLVRYYVHDRNLSHDYPRQRAAFIQLLQKHSAFFALNSAFLARQHAMLGSMYLRELNIGEALRAFSDTVKYAPFEWRSYLSVLRAVRAARRARRIPGRHRPGSLQP